MALTPSFGLPRFAPEDPAFFRALSAVVLPAFIFAPLAGIPVGAAALGADILLAGVAWAGGWGDPGEVTRAVSWDVLVPVMGFFVGVRAVEEAGPYERAACRGCSR